MKTIPLTQGYEAIVDDEDYEALSEFKWLYHLGYAKRRTAGGRKGSKIIGMHRVVNQTPDGLYTDHINRNKLDNRKANLRTVTHQLNSINRPTQPNNTSGVRGVYRRSDGKKWFAAIQVDGRSIHLGSFYEFEDAVNARRLAEAQKFRDAR